jgi:hypothetical protein
MRAALRSLETDDAEELTSYSPRDPTHFGLGVRAVIGDADGIGEELFDMLVCSPSWLEAEQLTKGFRWGHGILVLARWDPEVVERAVRDLVVHAERDTWAEIGELLSRYTDWEFADYRG